MSNQRAFAFADGLRGFAALQVVLLHYASVFFPAMARENGPARTSLDAWIADGPLFFILDGGSAVCLFFIISGFVLAHSFRNATATVPSLVLRRTVRLGLPVLLGGVFALALLLGIGLDHDALVQATASDFVKRLYTQPLEAASVVRDLLLNSMLLGYAPLSLFDAFPAMGVQSIDHALNPPFWTLHVEFWGSMLVIALVRIERAIGRGYGVCIAALLAFVLCGTGFYAMFVAGWLLSWVVNRRGLPQGHGAVRSVSGAVLVGLGILLASAHPLPAMESVREWLQGWTVASSVNTAAFQSCVGSLVLFVGVLLLPAARRFLSTSPSALLGRLSFGLYLFHFPVLFTLSAWLYLKLQVHGHVAAAGIATLVGIAVTALIAYFFDRSLDKAIIRASHRAGGLLQRQAAVRLSP